jgi:hypothetical protein
VAGFGRLIVDRTLPTLPSLLSLLSLQVVHQLSSAAEFGVALPFDPFGRCSKSQPPIVTWNSRR